MGRCFSYVMFALLGLGVLSCALTIVSLLHKLEEIIQLLYARGFY